jgi:glutamyl-tRNA reductase
MPGLVVVGLSHHAASVEVRERLAFDQATWRAAAPAALPTVLLSTCNRVEVYAWAETRNSVAIQRIERSLARAAGLSLAELHPHLLRRRGQEALLHLVRVAAGLDSMVVGEDQIGGQIKEAVRLAEQSQRLPAPLRSVFQRAAESARRVRGGTRLGSVPSIASAAVHVAQRTLPSPLSGQSAVVLGAGVMAKTAAQCLLALGARVTLLNRTPEHARTVARRLRGDVQVGSLDELASRLADAAVLIGATASRQPVVQTEVLRETLTRPLLVLDIALPRDVEPSARRLENVQLIDLDDLERLCPVDVAERQAELRHAESLAAAEAERMARWLRLRSASPVIAELRTYGERIRARELRRSSARLKDLTPDQIAAVEALTAGIVNKLLHGPTLALRDAATRPNGLNRSRSRILQVLRPQEGRTA